MIPDYNPLDEMEQLPPFTELEQLQEDYAELRCRLRMAKLQIDTCILFAELGTNTLLLNNLKKIKL